MTTAFDIIQKLHKRTEKYLRLFLQARKEEQEAILRLLADNSDGKPELFFDDAKRTIRWNSGIMRLSVKRYRLIKLLWDGKNHSADIDVIEETVWQLGQSVFVEKHTMMTLILHTQHDMVNANFPYMIESVKNPSTRELAGYRLVPAAMYSGEE